MSQNVLTVQGLKKSFKKGIGQKQVDAIKGISFEIPRGCVTGFLGANGAGKTTTIKCLLGLAFPDSGTIQYFGNSSLTSEVKSKIGFLPERPYFYEYLTGREFLKFYGALAADIKRVELRSRVDALLKRVGLTHAADRPLRSYSKGMLQRIGIAQALVHQPEFIILDEPMTGLDPDGRFEVREIIRETAQTGTSVFFSSHLLPDAEQLCERLVILKKGELVYHGTTENLLGKVSIGFQLATLPVSGTQPLIESVQTNEELQALIDQRRRDRSSILEVKPKRLTLEEAFVKIAMGGPA